MPFDLRKATVQPNRTERTDDKLADVLRDPLESHTMGLKDKLADFGSRMIGKDIVEDEDGRKKDTTRKAAKTEAAIAEIGGMGRAKVGYLRTQFGALLREHMEAEFNVENLDFLEALDAGLGREELVDEFIRAGAPREINVASGTRSSIVGGTTEPEGARSEVEAMIAGDVWNRFYKNPAFRAAVAERL